MSAQRPAWARFAVPGYEVSSAGDRRFSALVARLADGRSIEEAYQLDVKRYRATGATSWRAGKGRPPLWPISRAALWLAYLGLWQTWARENPALIADLHRRSAGIPLTDRFAATNVSQARALATILADDGCSSRTADLEKILSLTVGIVWQRIAATLKDRRSPQNAGAFRFPRRPLSRRLCRP